MTAAGKDIKEETQETPEALREPHSGAYLVGIAEDGQTAAEVRENLDELRELVRTLGSETVGSLVVNLRAISSKYYIGSGKAQEIADDVKKTNAAVVVFDSELGPSQQRNMETLCGVKVVDRHEVILDIFAKRASTKEAVLQVELARNKYFLPRLTRAWSHLSRQGGGGTGTRGEGEKQLEYDKRAVRMRITELEHELADVRKQRAEQRKERLRKGMPLAAIVGYTNAGKSSFLNRITGAEVYVENKLFATLDPTTRRYVMPDKSGFLLTDTVGFVRKLPHALVEAFKSTLEETVLADFLILVLDASSHSVEKHWETTMKVLADIGAADKPVLAIFNKCDRAIDPLLRNRLKSRAPDGLFVSVLTGEGLDALPDAFRSHMKSSTSIVELRIPPDKPDITAGLYGRGSVIESEYLDDGTFKCTVRLPFPLQETLKPFILKEAK